MADLLTRATFGVSEDNLRRAVLDKDVLPAEFAPFEVFREGVLDNAAMAEQGFPGTTTESIRRHGRITGHLKEYVSKSSAASAEMGANIAVATVIHIFDTKDAVLHWMNDVFRKEFAQNVGKAVGKEQELVAVDDLPVRGFHDQAVCLKIVQRGPKGLLSSTIVDFRIGRLLGVAYVVTYGTADRRLLVEDIGHRFERQIVRVVLGSA